MMMQLARFCAIGLALLAAACASSNKAEVSTAMAQANVTRGADGSAVMALPDCPNWRRSSVEDFTNRVMSNFGCADAVNLVRQLADPFHLVGGQGTIAREGRAAAAAVERYRRGETTPLSTSTASGATLAPTATPGSGSPQ